MATSRWSALAVLFTARVTMAFQFQAVAALGPVLVARHGTSLADLGLLIGLYLAPGLAFALPGGGIAGRFGAARVIAFGLALMVLGGVAMWLGASWEAQIAGRLLAGTGGVLLNVLMTKMVTDLFAGREIGTAMGIFVNSWPVGIALALLVLPSVATGFGLDAALALTLAVTVFGLGLFVMAVPMPAPKAHRNSPSVWPRGAVLAGVVMAGLIWGLYNAALGMVFSFGPTVLVERGWALPTASSAISLVLWLTAVSVPLGGWLADRSGARDAVLLAGLTLFGVGLWAFLLGFAPWPVMVLLGLCAGLAAAPIMALPSLLVTPADGALGMGLFFTMFYLMIVLGPILAGRLSDQVSSSAAALGLGIGLSALCVPLLWGVRRCAAFKARAAA